MNLRATIHDCGGSVAIEFAILGPALITMMLAVLQFGIAMQAYNSLRSVAAETARYATVQYQKSSAVTNTTIQAQARAIAVSDEYGLKTAELGVTVTTPATQRVAGAGERTLSMTYSVPIVMQIIDLPPMTLTYTRPIFILTP